MSKQKHPGGRPSQYDPAFCEMLITHMEQGKAFESFGALIYRETGGQVRPCKQTLYTWLDKHEEFLDAKKIGEMLCFDFWEELAITAINSPPGQFNTGVYVFNMKNRFGWRDKVEQTVIGDAEKPVRTESVAVDPAQMTPEQRKTLFDRIANGRD